MICEGKTYSKKLIKMDQLGKDDQVRVQRSDKNELVAQYFCDKSNCAIHICDKCFENQSGYLVLILHNISHSDRFDAFLNSKILLEENFTLDEDVPSTSTTTAVPDETPIPSINPTEDVPSTSTTTAVPDETTTTSIKPKEPPHTTKMPEAPTGEALSTEAKVAIGIGAVVLAVIVLAVIAHEVYAQRTGRDGIIAKVARKFCGHKQVEVGNPTEMKVFVPNNDRV